mmetsp:Transcript_8636/g.22276  ORF Transcript_8636/g.22276 Transcript_8636/m.22276 type:complete len:157 (+) Transcript_8636:210-680(+)
MPFLPLYDGGHTRMQPVWVRDVAQAFSQSLKMDGAAVQGKTFELGGPDVYAVRDLVKLVERTIREESNSVHVPSHLGKMLDGPRAFLQQRVSFPVPTLSMFTSDFIDEMATDLVVADGARTIQNLGVSPKKINEGVPVEHVRFWRSGGYDFGSTFE